MTQPKVKFDHKFCWKIPLTEIRKIFFSNFQNDAKEPAKKAENKQAKPTAAAQRKQSAAAVKQKSTKQPKAAAPKKSAQKEATVTAKNEKNRPTKPVQKRSKAKPMARKSAKSTPSAGAMDTKVTTNSSDQNKNEDSESKSLKFVASFILPAEPQMDVPKPPSMSPPPPPMPPAPKKIMEYLNKHVIGQDHAKKVLSVAVYNHYKRIHHNATAVAANNNNNEPSSNAGPSSANNDDAVASNGAADSVQTSNQSKLPQTSEQPPVDAAAKQPIVGSVQFNLDKPHVLTLEKSNILMLGPTGSGKTLLAQTTAKCLDVPFAICDCTKLTQAGYVGDNIESVVSKLLLDANYE